MKALTYREYIKKGEVIMKKSTKQFLCTTIAVPLTVGLLGGCSSANSSSGNLSSDSSTLSDVTTIEFFNQKPEIVNILNKLISEYETKNPNVKIKLTTPANSSTVLSTRMASGQTPDIFTNWPSSTFFTQVDSGYVMDLSGTGIMDNIQDTARNQWKYKNGEYAATMSYNVSGIWYNKDLFEQANISNPPKTWDELINDCDKLKSAGITPFILSAKETSIADRQLQVFLASSMKNGYEEFEKDASAKMLDANKDYAKSLNSMAEKMLQILNYAQDDVMGTDQDSATADFANGKGAMMIGGSWLLASVTQANPNINIAMMPIPGETEGETNTCAYPGDMSLCIAKDTKVKEAAIDFVKWMTSTEIASEYAKLEGNPSCVKGVDYVAPQFADLYKDYVTAGKYILNPDCNWTIAQQDAAGVAVQQLYNNKKADAFAESLVSAFNDN